MLVRVFVRVFLCEVAACLRVLEDGKSLPTGSRAMLLRFYDLWANEQVTRQPWEPQSMTSEFAND